MPRILYLYRDSPFARFIQDDQRILQSRYTVDAVRMEKDPRTLKRILVSAARADLIYFWWGDLTGASGALMAALQRKPSVMITGGYDVAAVPEIRYGLRYHPWRRFLPPAVLSMASAIIANAHFARDGVLRDYGVPHEKIHMVPHGFEAQAIPLGTKARAKKVLTCSLISEEYIPYKGLETFVRAAKLLPDVHFVHVGKPKEQGALRRLRQLAGKNVDFLGFVEESELIEQMQSAAVYAQLSAHEGFGVALAESMLAGATPVVTPCGAMPEVAGEVASYAAYADVEGTATAIERALANPRGEAARARILREFPFSRREEGVLSVVGSLLGR